jgi:hypothetical protein
MKKFALFVLFAITTVVAFGADSPTVTGKWTVHISIAGNDSDMSCTFATKDSAITGTCNGQLGELDVTGKIDGTKVSFGYKSEYNGSPLTLNYQGTIDGANGMKGTVTVVEYGVDGDFSATPVKE